jgi:hypothetical protein
MENMKTKSTGSASELGLVSKEKLDYKNIRGETNDKAQMPMHKETSEKTDRGTFQYKG